MKEKKEKIPNHIAIIMDGNGRWAKKQGKERFWGHQAGAEAAKDVSIAASDFGVNYLTLYAFSKENWKRPKDEVDKLMNLLIKGVEDNLDELISLNIRIRIIGDIENLPEDVRIAIKKVVESSAKCTGLNLNLALNYSSRWEITNAMKKIAEKVKKGEIDTNNIDENLISEHLQTAGIPDPDYLIRTSGEYRISNFLLWQMTYTEMYFTKTLWPDFKREELKKAIEEYQKRERRFGKISEQL